MTPNPPHLPGRAGFLWPGLNMPVSREGAAKSIARRDPAEQQELQAERLRQRDEWDRRRKMRVKRERGWTGHSWGGVSIGPPDPGPNGGEPAAGSPGADSLNYSRHAQTGHKGGDIICLCCTA